MNKKILSIFVLVLTLAFANRAFASLTFTTNAITGTTASTIDLGAGNALSLQTVSNGAINLGTGTVTAGGDLLVDGSVGIGGTDPLATLYVAKTTSVNNFNYAGYFYNSTPVTEVGYSSIVGVSGLGSVSSSTASPWTIFGGEFIASNKGDEDVGNSISGVSITAYNNGKGDAPQVNGISLQAGNSGDEVTGPGIVTEANGIWIGNYAQNADITNSRGIYIENPYVLNAVIDNNYGIYIANQTSGGTLNYSIYSDGGTNYFAGNVGIGTATPGASSILDISSTTKGVVLPRMTQAQRNAIATPVAGMAIYQTDAVPGLRVYNGTNWMRLTETAD